MTKSDNKTTQFDDVPVTYNTADEAGEHFLKEPSPHTG